MGELQRVRETLGRFDPGTKAAQRAVAKTGAPDPIKEQAQTEALAKQSQERQRSLIAERRQQEQLRVAEEQSDIARRRAIARKPNPLIRTSLIS